MPDRAPSSAAARPTAAPAVFWRGSWAAAQQPLNPNVPGWARQGFANQSVRQVVRLTVGGTMVRVRLSNLYGSTPLRLTGATIARASAGAGVKRGSQRNLTFSSRPWAQIPAGRELNSDPLRMSTTAKEKLTVTLYFAQRTGPATYHSQAIADSYRAEGDHRADPGGGAYAPQRTGITSLGSTSAAPRHSRATASSPWATPLPTEPTPPATRITATPTSSPNV